MKKIIAALLFLTSLSGCVLVPAGGPGYYRPEPVAFVEPVYVGVGGYGHPYGGGGHYWR